MQKNALIIYTISAVSVLIGIIYSDEIMAFITGAKSDSMMAIKSSGTLEVISTDEYDFYYPATYVDSEPQFDEDLLYVNPDTKAVTAERVFLNIQDGPGYVGESSFAACQAFGETLRKSTSEKISVTVITDDLVGEGCEIVVESPIPNTSDAAVAIRRFLWRPNDPNTTIYVAAAVYFRVASADQAPILEYAVRNFTLK